MLFHYEQNIAPVQGQVFKEGKEKSKHLFLICHGGILLILLHQSITIVKKFVPNGLLQRFKGTEETIKLLFLYFMFLTEFEYRAWHLFIFQYRFHEQAYNFILGDFGFSSICHFW